MGGWGGGWVGGWVGGRLGGGVMGEAWGPSQCSWEKACVHPRQPASQPVAPYTKLLEKTAHLGDHLIVGVSHQRDALQGGNRACQQGHVGGHGEGDLKRGRLQVTKGRAGREARQAGRQVGHKPEEQEPTTFVASKSRRPALQALPMPKQEHKSSFPLTSRSVERAEKLDLKAWAPPPRR